MQQDAQKSSYAEVVGEKEKAEVENRDAKGRAWTAETELSSATSKIKEVSLIQSPLASRKTRVRATTKITLFHSIRFAPSSLGAARGGTRRREEASPPTKL